MKLHMRYGQTVSDAFVAVFSSVQGTDSGIGPVRVFPAVPCMPYGGGPAEAPPCCSFLPENQQYSPIELGSLLLDWQQGTHMDTMH